MTAAPTSPPSRRLARGAGLLVVSLVACLAGIATPAVADEPVFTAGPSGLPTGGHMSVQSVTPCPAPPGSGGWFANVTFVQGGHVISYVDIPVSADGSWRGDVLVPFAAVPGAAELQAVCFDTTHAVGATLTYQPVDIAVGSTKATFAAAPASSSAQSPFAVHSLTPCPEPMTGHGWMARVELVQSIAPAAPPSYDVVGAGFFPVDAGGNWSGTLDLPLDVVAGPAYLVATCYYTLGPNPAPDDVYYEPVATTIDPPVASLSTKSLSFGSVRLGGTSSPRTVTLTNRGGVPLIVTSVTLAGSSARDFRITSDTCGAHALPSGVTCSTSVSFRPGADATRTATLTYSDNAASSPQDVALSGRGCRLLLGPFCL